MTTRWLAIITLTATVLGASASARRGAPGDASVSTVLGNGAPGFSEQQVNNPYGLAFGPDGALYFCDLDNQRIRRLDLQTKSMTTVAGNGQKGYRGEIWALPCLDPDSGGPAAAESLRKEIALVESWAGG